MNTPLSPADAPPPDGAIDGLIDALVEHHWAFADGLFPSDLVHGLREEAIAAWEDEAYIQASVGNLGGRLKRPEIRSDHVLWIEEEHMTRHQATYWAWMDALRLRLRRDLFLPLDDFEGHLAVYPPGSFYKRHLDQFKSVQRRQISCILYLNPSWDEDAGGQLRIYEPDEEGGERHIDMLPEPGRFVLFRSDSIPHEVLPATRDRYSLTGWLRRAA